MELLSLAQQLYKKWEITKNIFGYAIVTNKQGRVRFGIVISNWSKDTSGIFIVPEAIELSMNYFCDRVDALAKTDYDLEESFIYRGATQIKFERWSQLEREIRKSLLAAGLQKRKKDTIVPLPLDKKYFGLNAYPVNGDRQIFIEKVLKILLHGSNFEVIVDSIKKNTTNKLPVIHYNQVTKECTATNEVMDFPDLATDPFFQPYFGTLVPEDTRTDGEWQHLLQNIKAAKRVPIEVRLGVVSPLVRLGLHAPGSLLFQACIRDTVNCTAFNYENLDYNYPFLQDWLLQLCEEKGVRPSKIIVKGNIPHFVKNQLTPLANHLNIPIAITNQRGRLEHLLTEIELKQIDENEVVREQYKAFLEHLLEYSESEIFSTLVNKELSRTDLNALRKEFGFRKE